MPGDLNQTVYIKGIPEGLKFIVTDVKPSIPDKSGWSAGLDTKHHGSITQNDKGLHNHLHLPFEVNPKKHGGILGEFKLRPNSGLRSTSAGGKVDVTFTVEGKTTVAGKTFNVPKAVGYISVSSTEWKGLQRPDFTNVTYYWPTAAPINLSVSVPPTIGTDPADVFMVGAVDKKEQQFGLNATTHEDILKKVLDYAIQGILWANQEMAGWAKKQIMPFP